MNIFNSEGFTPLYQAVKFNSIEFVRFLLRKGADPNRICSNGNTPVHLAFKQKNLIVLYIPSYYKLIYR